MPVNALLTEAKERLEHWQLKSQVKLKQMLYQIYWLLEGTDTPLHLVIDLDALLEENQPDTIHISFKRFISMEEHGQPELDWNNHSTNR